MEEKMMMRRVREETLNAYEREKERELNRK